MPLSQPLSGRDYTGGARGYGRIEGALIPEFSPKRDSETRPGGGPLVAGDARG
jgi:hypothetical protein